MYRDFKESLKPIPETVQEETPILTETKNEVPAILEPVQTEQPKVKPQITPKEAENKTLSQDDGILPPLKPEEEPPKWVQKINNFIEWLLRPENEDF